MLGKLVVIEGMDGSGTTTQAKLLATHLSKLGYAVKTSAEPTDSAIGQEARRLLAMPIEKDQHLLVSLALCFAADRMQHVHNLLVPSLKTMDFVILDRYVLSSLVYQGLHLPTAFVREINQFALKPDLTIVLDLDAKVAFDRLTKRVTTKDFYEELSMLEKIRKRYLHFAKDAPNTTVLIDANDEVGHVESHLRHVIEDKFLKRS